MDTQDFARFMLRPIEWAKTQYAEAFCLFGLMVFIGVLWGTMFLAFGLPIVFWILAGIGFVGLILFLVTLVLFAMEEKRKEREVLERRKKNDASKRT